ncbi:MAG TPA: pirin family protein [Candidatus Nanopelagicales bacterium]|nr:pirin family protein [Candidatus Nanopelagicales bacterium]
MNIERQMVEATGPAITLRRASERGHLDFGWLDTNHTFSFGSYHDPRHMGFRVLRVINEDRVTPGEGFPTHPHRDMEIITYVLEGALEHKDSMGTGSVIRPGDVQRMSAGTGVTHSEYNASRSEGVHFLQIWILPEARGLAPGYEQKGFSAEEKRGKLRLVASRSGAEGSVRLNQDMKLYATLLEAGEEVRFEREVGRHAWVHVARGEAELNGRPVAAGDGASVSGEGAITLRGVKGAEILVFDLP